MVSKMCSSSIILNTLSKLINASQAKVTLGEGHDTQCTQHSVYSVHMSLSLSAAAARSLDATRRAITPPPSSCTVSMAEVLN